MLELPYKWGKYILLEHIASGGMAEIYLAIPADPNKAQRLLVIKRIRPTIKSEKELLKMFRIETQALLELDSPFIVKIFDSNEAEEVEPYLAMEYIDGISLKQCVEALSIRGVMQFPIHIALEVIKQVFAGLSTAHDHYSHISGSKNVILHRDVSPHNLIVSCSGHMKIIDFGVAKFESFDSATLFTGQVKGKLNYMSPEQFLGEQIDSRTDVFSTGIVLWELLSGQRFFKSENTHQELAIEKFARGSYRPMSLKLLNPKVDDEVCAFVETLTAVKKEDRIASASEAANWINSYQHKMNFESGVEALRNFIDENFNEIVQHERRKIQILIEKAKSSPVKSVGPEDETLRMSVSAKKTKHVWVWTSVSVITLLLIFVFVYRNSGTNSESSNKTMDVNRNVSGDAQSKVELRANGVTAMNSQDREAMRSISMWIREVLGSESAAVKRAWDEAYNRDEKTRENKKYVLRFRQMEASKRSQLISEMKKFIEVFDSLSSDNDKLLLIQKHKEQIESLPPRRRENSQDN